MIIENKIYAGDVNKQIYRYREFLNENSKKYQEKRNGTLLYLTVNGRAASKQSTLEIVDENSPNGYYTISYYKEIKKWLNPFLKEDIPFEVKYSIDQYLVLISYLNFEAKLRDDVMEKKSLLNKLMTGLKLKI